MELDEVLNALGNPHRRRTVELLALHPMSVSDLARALGLSLTAIDRHLTVLEHSGLIQRRKSGRVTFVAIRRASLRLLQEWAISFNTQWGADDETLENYVDAMGPHDSEPHITLPASQTRRKK